MDLARVVFDESDADVSEVSGVATGGIWLRVGRLEFPATGWNDFAVVVLAGWADAALRLLEGDSTRRQIYFMDGPYAVEMTAAPGGAWRLVLVERRRSGRRTHSVSVDPAPLVESITEAADRLLTICQKRGWLTSDPAQLADTVAQLRSRTGRSGLA